MIGNSNLEGILLPIPDKVYFTIGEASALCLVKPYVIRYWEKEFSDFLAPNKRQNHRYYIRDEIKKIRKIRELLYREGYTISGARFKLKEISGGNIKTGGKTKVIKEVITELTKIVKKLETR